MRNEDFQVGKKYKLLNSSISYTCVGFRTDGYPILEAQNNKNLLVPSVYAGWREVRDPRERFLVIISKSGCTYSVNKTLRQAEQSSERYQNRWNEGTEIVHMREVQDA